jgi:hypothetical protein
MTETPKPPASVPAHQLQRNWGDRRAYRIEDLPDDLAALLETGLDELRNGVAEDGDNIID